ncbi:hypothetical protein GN958_ATG17766 [Phytophthora infestans]|uniref:MARVEL domain-containing protein n=1 Tax=Phytophthora infestans TaxID=4787 RepID=A0A8S9TX45_PHYIN|nr:hypothetical protein GN958_ATG17766 [Phytophthora infestans]
MARGSCSRFCMRVFLRLVQFCSALVAYIALRTAGVSYQSTAGGQTVAVVVSSSAMSFARIINFIAFLYAFAFLVFIEWLRLCVHPIDYCERVMDLVLFVCLATATLLLLLSGVTLHCHGKYNRFVRCGGVYLAVAASFLATFAFLGISMIGTRDEERQRQRQQGGRSGRGSDSYAEHGGATPVPVVTAQPV